MESLNPQNAVNSGHSAPKNDTVHNTQHTEPEVFTLGVTGGIGSGKTTVCNILKELGAWIFSADDEAKRIMVEHAGVRQEITSTFGDTSYNEDGTLNRHQYLAQQIFGDESKVARINQIVHPRVFEAFRERRALAKKAGVSLLVHEAALTFESGGYKHLDAVAVVYAPETRRIDRVQERDGASEEQIRKRMHHQIPVDEALSRADYVIDNDGSLEDLRQKVVQLFQEVTRQGSGN